MIEMNRRSDKYIFIFFLIFYVSNFLSAQGKKNIRKYNIKLMIENITEGKTTYKSEQKTFDSNGNEQEWIKYNKDGSIMKKVVYKYDQNNNLLEEQEFSGNQLNRKKVYTYNRFDEKETEITYDASGQMLKKEVFTYNNKGLKSEKKVYDGNNNLIEIHSYNYYSK